VAPVFDSEVAVRIAATRIVMVARAPAASTERRRCNRVVCASEGAGGLEAGTDVAADEGSKAGSYSPGGWSNRAASPAVSIGWAARAAGGVSPGAAVTSDRLSEPSWVCERLRVRPPHPVGRWT
jgi:hypothetical protein